VILGVVDVLGGTADDVFRVLRDLLGPLSLGILEEARQQGINPRALAVQKTTAKVTAARSQPAVTPDLEQLINDMRKRLGFTA